VAVWAVGAAFAAAWLLASVPPGLALNRASDREGSRFGVEVTPLETERFALADAERQCQRETDPVPPVARGGKDALRLVDGEWLDFRFNQARRLGDGRRVLDDPSAPLGLVQRRRKVR